MKSNIKENLSFGSNIHENHLITTKESQDSWSGKILDDEDGGAHDDEDGDVQQEGHRQRHLGHAHKHVGRIKSLG